MVIGLLPRVRGQADWVVDQMCGNYIRHGEFASQEAEKWVAQSIGMIAFAFGTDDEDAQNVLQVVLRNAVLAKLADSGTVEEEPPF